MELNINRIQDWRIDVLQFFLVGVIKQAQNSGICADINSTSILDKVTRESVNNALVKSGKGLVLPRKTVDISVQQL